MSDNELQLYDGKLNAFGLDISISEIIGSKIVDQYMAKLSPEDIALIDKAIEEEMFDHDYSDQKYFVKKRKTDHSSWGCSTEETPIWKITQSRFKEKYTDLIVAKVDELIASEKYQKQAEKVAEDIIEYALEGYKKDIMELVRERLVCNVLGQAPTFGGINLHDVIREEIYNASRPSY